MSREEVERVAADLTKVERTVVLSTVPGESRPYRAVHGMPRVALFRKGVIGPTEYMDPAFFVLTPLGLAVRAYLKERGK